ncbi:DUF1007 family protein [Arenibaculum pallidiluteum]|uniref:DUF1007 family protein n=1 Tax=Arenibaculum pallidiluteum TaxID=2812559 RepID=UPI001A96745A|nr:DUF1007 family protein [Arenibaculum pallidiluteum]
MSIRAAATAGILLAAPDVASAHPHAYVVYGATLRFDNAQRIAAIEMLWLFDEMYSAYASDGLDTNGDGRIDPEELAPLAAENLAQLAEWSYFTYLKSDGRRIPLGPAGAHASRLEQGRIEMRFTLPLAEPVDPRGTRVTFSSFDPTFYIDVTPLERDGFATAGAAPPDCRAVPGPDPAAGGGPRYVPDATARQLDIGPEDDVDASIGARFARWIAVDCGSSR